MEESAPRTGRWDDVVRGLQDLRTSVGEPSYAELARKVSDLRRCRGLDEHCARVARTTVYDAFRTGRKRVNLELVRDLATVLGAPDDTVDRWLANGSAHQAVDAASEPVEAPTPAQDCPGALEPSRRAVAALLVGCVVVNLLGRQVVDLLDLPIYLDMVGTAVSAIALGPWYGVGVGLATNSLAVLTNGFPSLPFGLVNAAGALVWGYGVRHGWGRTLPRFFTLNLVAAVVCSVLAVPILVLMFSGSTGHGEDTVAASLAALGQTFLVSVAGANLLISIADKTISGFVAIVALSMLPWGRGRGVDFLAPPPTADADPDRIST